MNVATLRAPEGSGGVMQNRITSAYPNVTFIPLSDVAERIAAQLNRIGWGVRMLGLFIVGAAIAVLAGTIGIESNRRGREVALLKTVGMTRREVAGVFAAEYALLGLVAGIIGVTGGGVVAWLMVVRALETEFHWPYGLFALAIAAGMLVSVAAGITASAGALRKRPIEMLRHQE
jgi:putative ABC transport system permease protein